MLRIVNSNRTRRHTLAGLIFAAIVIPIIYLLARNMNRNHGPVPPEEQWRKMTGQPDPSKQHHHRRY